MNKIRIYYQPYERSDELMEIGVWVADSEMQFSLWDTIPGPYNPKAVGVFEEYDMTGVTTPPFDSNRSFRVGGISGGSRVLGS